MTLVQRSLFPDAFEVQDAALAALEVMDLGAARELVRAACARDPGLVGLVVLEATVRWLDAALHGEPPAPENLAAAFRALPAAVSSRELARDAARFVDRSLARHAVLRADGGTVFLDAGETVHRGALHLVLDRSAAARAELRATLEAGHRGRADLWAYLGDACMLEERADEANAAYVRALVLSAADVDLYRIRAPRLAELHATLRATLPDAVARESLLTHAWLERVLAIPTENEWLDEGQVAAVLAEPADAGAPAERRQRRFARLVYADRSRAPGAVDLEEREEMLALDAELFRRYVAACERGEGGATRRMPW